MSPREHADGSVIGQRYAVTCAPSILTFEGYVQCKVGRLGVLVQATCVGNFGQGVLANSFCHGFD